MSDPDDAVVAYTVKELLARIEKNQTEGFARLDTSVASKADKADVARLETRLEQHTKDIGELQGFRDDLVQQRVKRFRLGANAWRLIWGALGLAATSFATYAGIHGL